MAIFAYFAGAFTITAALLDWDWFFNNRRAVFFVRAFGRSGARVFYVMLGILILAIASCLPR